MTEGGPTPLAYATPVAPPRPLLGATVLTVLSLGMVFLSGCFLIGVGVVFDVVGIPNDPPQPWSVGTYTFVGVLYACAAATFLGGLWVALLAVRKLTSV